MKKSDIVLFCCYIVLSFSLIIHYVSSQTTGDMVVVSYNKQTKNYPLNQNATIHIEEDNVHASICIENGAVYFYDNNCPDQLCMKNRPIRKSGEMIVCLPHRIIVSIENTQNKSWDLIL